MKALALLLFSGCATLLAGRRGGMKDTCQECKGPNIVWFTYNTLWNKVVDSKPAILCPICFTKGAEEKGVRPSSWYLTDKGDGQGELLAEAYQKLYEANERIAKLKSSISIIRKLLENRKGHRMKIYLASSWKNEQLVLDWANLLRIKGHEVDAFCDESSGRFVFHFSEIGDAKELNAVNFLANERSQKAFAEDKKWIDWAEVVLLILPAGKSSHLEAGYAKGCGKCLIIWQEEFPKGEFDVMYGFADLITDSINEVIDFLA